VDKVCKMLDAVPETGFPFVEKTYTYSHATYPSGNGNGYAGSSVASTGYSFTRACEVCGAPCTLDEWTWGGYSSNIKACKASCIAKLEAIRNEHVAAEKAVAAAEKAAKVEAAEIAARDRANAAAQEAADDRKFSIGEAVLVTKPSPPGLAKWLNPDYVVEGWAPGMDDTNGRSYLIIDYANERYKLNTGAHLGQNYWYKEAWLTLVPRARPHNGTALDPRPARARYPSSCDGLTR